MTVAILIAHNQDEELEDYITRALEAGVTPAEISETITHLAFYWSNAMSAVDKVVIVSSDGDQGGGGWAYRARTFGRGHP